MLIGVEECEKYLENSTKKLENIKDSKKHLTRFKELYKTLEKATNPEKFKKYLWFYIEVRRNKLKLKKQADSD